jgi:bifunctional non-homologous end joining protein LigD
VIKVALATKEFWITWSDWLYKKHQVSTGIHVYIPLGAKYTYDQCQMFGRIIATQVNNMLPDITSIERLTKARKK